MGRAGRAPSGPAPTNSARSLYARTEEADRAVVDRVGEVAAARALPRAQVALAWLLAKPAVTSPIIGATKPHHLEDAVAALVDHAHSRGDDAAGGAIRASPRARVFRKSPAPSPCRLAGAKR